MSPSKLPLAAALDRVAPHRPFRQVIKMIMTITVLINDVTLL